MPLILPTLQKPFELLFALGTKAAPDAAKKMSDAYVAYTSTAIFGAALPVFTGTEGPKLMATLIAVLNPALMNPAGLAGAWSAGILAFWTTPPIVCAGGTPGTVTAVPGASALLASMTAVCLIPGQPAAVAAAAMAACIDVATKTAVATLMVGPVPTATPIA